MAVTFHTLTGDVTDILGADFPLDRVTGATLETNLARDQALVAGSTVRLPGVGKVDVQADGTFSVANLVASNSADTNVDPDAPLLYRLNIRYRHPQAARGRNVIDVPVWSSPWFALNGSGTTTLANVVEVAYLPASLISQATATLEAARDDAVSDVQAAGTSATLAATMQADRAETEADRAEQAADDAVDISGIDTSDDVVSALVAGTAGAGPATRAALSAQQAAAIGSGAYVEGMTPGEAAAAVFARFFLYRFGAIGDGVIDDSDAVEAALGAAEANGGGTVDLSHPFVSEPRYKVTRSIQVPGGVNVAGWSGGKGTAASTFVCSGPTARLIFGDGTDAGSRGGLSGGFSIDGGGDNLLTGGSGDPTGLLVMDLCVMRTFQAIHVGGGAGDGWRIVKSQNNTFIGVDSTFHVGTALVVDEGAGGNLWVRSEIGSSGKSLVIQETTGTGPYPDPQHNHWLHCIIENFAATGDTLLEVTAGVGNVFTTPVFSSGTVDLTDGHCIVMAGGELELRDPKFFGGGLNGAVKLSNSSALRVMGHTLVKNCPTAWTASGSNAGFGVIEEVTYAAVTTRFATESGGAFTNFFTRPATPFNLQGDGTFGYLLRGGRSTDAGYRFTLDRDGLLGYNDGTDFTSDATIGYLASDPAIQISALRVTGRTMRTEAVQTLTSTGTVTVNTQTASVHVLTLQANASGMTFTNPKNGADLTITVVQDATGGRTYAWPGNCRFAGGTAPADTTASTRTTVNFRYDSALGRWHETGRAVAVPA